MANRRARLAECVAVAVALTAVAKVLTADRLPTGRWVLVVVEFAGGVAIGRAAIAVFSAGGDPTLGDKSLSGEVSVVLWLSRGGGCCRAGSDGGYAWPARGTRASRACRAWWSACSGSMPSWRAWTAKL